MRRKMMSYQFSAYGHPNITAKHKTTLEFTKDKNVSLKGDCIIGVNTDFEIKELKKFIQNYKSEKIHIEIKSTDGKIKDEFEAELNKEFDDEREIVIRMGSFKSKRTLAINASKSASHLKEFSWYLKDPNNKLIVKISS